MAKIPFLDHKTKLWLDHEAAWRRDERRLHGGDAVLTDLIIWAGESEKDHEARLLQAVFPDLPKRHASRLVGLLSKQTPMPNFAELGEVRKREEINTPTRAELLWFNADGIGQDGTELVSWIDAVNERALATGYRWVMVETPTLDELQEMRAARGLIFVRPIITEEPLITDKDVVDGFRPYGVEYSPLDVPFWQYTSGRLDFAVIRVPVNPVNLLDASGSVEAGKEKGYYLLVRRGFTGLGETYAVGGWWTYDADHNLQGEGRWNRTRGQIPLFQFVGERSTGTHERPSEARSLTMELGQISSGLMSLISAQHWNAIYAGKSINYFLGIQPKEHAQVIQQQNLGSISVGVPPVTLPDGTVGIPQLVNSSAAAIDTGVFTAIIEAQLAIAREIMVRQIESAPNASGARVEAGHAEETSPLLARLAATRQGAINTFLYFYSLRSGFDQPRAVVEIPREFDLQPVVDDIDAMLSTLKRSFLRSPTWEADLVLKAGDERGLLPEDKRQAIEAELTESAKVPEGEGRTEDMFAA